MGIVMIATLIGFVIGLAFADKIADEKIKEKREEMQLDEKEPNMWIDGNWYTEFEVEAKFHEMQDEIRELKKSVDIYRTIANNAMLERKDESEVYD